MATVKDLGMEWQLTIYPEATPVEEINEPSKGYHALLGLDSATDRHVIMYVWYNKSQYSIGEVLKKIDEMKSCPRCDTLDKDKLKDVTIEVRDRAQPTQQSVRFTQQTGASQPAPIQAQPRSNVKDMFANAMFDAYLTPAGKFLVGNVFGDEKLVEESFPKTPDELAQLWSDTTSGKLLRSPDEAQAFMSILKGGSEKDDATDKKKVKKLSQGIVIY